MQIRFLPSISCTLIAVGFILIALPLGTNEFSTSCYLAALALLAVAALRLVAGTRQIGSVVGLSLAALATLNLTRLLIGATLDLAVFLLLAGGLAGSAFFSARPTMWTRTSILFGVAGALMYLVHDVIAGYTSQLPADALWTFGFGLLWYAEGRNG